MKTIHFLSAALIISMIISCQSSENNTFQFDIPKGKNAKKTVYYFVRHAEKDTTDKENRDPQLTEEGIRRANYLATYFEDKDLNAFYSTDYSRTIQTLIPTVHKFKGDIISYKAEEDSLFTKQFWTETYGRNVLVLGHSNTSPRFVNEVLESDKYENLDESNYNNFYKVEIDADLKVTDTILTKKVPKNFSYN
jgi:phosphohistidine phosphatase SixA